MDCIAFVSVPSAVDLGLSVMWANMDLNAGKDTESGAFYSWGKLRPKPNIPKKTINSEKREA